MLAAFGRHEAPVLAGVPGLAADETVFVLSGLVPNRRSHPLLYEWIAVAYRGAQYEALVPFDDVLARTGLGRGGVANRGRTPDVDALKGLLPDAVARARERVVQRRRDFESRINDKLNDEAGGAGDAEGPPVTPARAAARTVGPRRRRSSAPAKNAGRRDIDAIFDEYLTWIEDTMTTEPQPYIKVVCVMTGEPAERGD